ncbi:MAG TPA: COX15/CtaA family protein, partial [Sphingobacteriaceae bacterium]
ALAGMTWPSINGTFLPRSLLTEGSFLADITHNLLTVQFIHRNLAYLLALGVIFWCYRAGRLQAGAVLRRYRYLPVVLIVLQIVLGILALINSLDRTHLILFGLLHQFGGMLILLTYTITLFFTRSRAAV